MSFHEQVHVMGHDLPCCYSPSAHGGSRADQLLTVGRDPVTQGRAAVLRAPRHVISQATDATCENLQLPGHAGDYTHGLCQNQRSLRRLKTAVPSRGV
jgi:hypothetical protein